MAVAGRHLAGLRQVLHSGAAAAAAAANGMTAPSAGGAQTAGDGIER